MSKCIGAAVGGLHHPRAYYGMSLRERHLRTDQGTRATFPTRLARETSAATDAQRRVGETIAPCVLALARAAQPVQALGRALSGLQRVYRRGADGPPALLLSLAIRFRIAVQLRTLRGSSFAGPMNRGALALL